MRRILVLVLACSLAMVASGCGDEDCCGPEPSGAASPTRPTTPAPTPTPSLTEAPTTNPPTTPPSEGLQKVRVVGEVVEVGDCVVVRDDNDITWTITGALAASLVRHDRVQVTGAPDLGGTGCGGPLVKAAAVTVLPPVG